MSRLVLVPIVAIFAACVSQQATPVATTQSPYHKAAPSTMAAAPNAVDVAQHHPLRAWIDSDAVVTRSVLVHQDLARGTSALVASATESGRRTPLPKIDLHGVLRVQLEGIATPVTFCAPADDPNPSPCLRASDVTVDSPWARVGPDGALRFVDSLSAGETAALADTARRLRMPLSIGGQNIAAFDLELRFETPNDLILRGDSRSTTGPNLTVQVAQVSTGRIAYTIRDNSTGRAYHAVVERTSADSFHVISRGADGERGVDGSSGRDGMTGTMGTSAMCPSIAAGDGGRGEDGSAGDRGQAGGDGGRGGNIIVEVRREGEADALLAMVRRTISSEGGSGGSGGVGGRGGRGGAGGLGGSGTTCVDGAATVSSLPGGSAGSGGFDGASGAPGMAGSRGAAGHVTIRIIE